MFGNKERRRKEERIKYFFFHCLDCNEGENKKRIYIFFILLYPYKCERYMKIMNRYITLYHIILCTWVLLFKNHSPPSITPNLSRLQICEFKRNGFLNFFLFITLWYPYKGKNYASSHLSSLPLSSRLSKRNVNFSKDLVPFTP